jgi:hypothetical protein
MTRDWTEWDPHRLERDRRDVSEVAPDLAYVAPGGADFPHGAWVGALPRWPFDRPEPDRLATLVPEPMQVALIYASAHPVTAPTVLPLNVEPDVIKTSDTAWHVLPSGALCLLQSASDWDPSASVGELLLKAAGWRIEYALMEAGRIDRMSERGIVTDGSLDVLITQACTS